MLKHNEIKTAEKFSGLQLLILILTFLSLPKTHREKWPFPFS